ncbi:MAG: hypothetical protein JWO89_3400 [Verrucomicrobiaceae bacterium]|nr:hypothetical protein [Verrucomicrobiaceae bacterium]
MRRLIFTLLFLPLLGAAVWLGLLWGDAAPEKTVTVGPVVSHGSQKYGPVTTQAAGGETAIESGTPSPEVVAAPTSRAPGAQANTEPPTGGEILEQWLTSSPDPDVIALNIIHGFGSLKPEDQALAASKAVAFIKEEHFSALRPLLMDSAISEEAQDIIYQDLLQRSAATRFPLLLTLMQTPNHPFSDKARQSLVRDLGADYGANYGLWQAKLKELIEAQK